MVDSLWILLGAALLASLGLSAYFPLRASLARLRLTEARRNFHRQRERLEAKFVQLGMARNRPAAARWNDGEFEDDVTFARSRLTGELSAFVAVTLEMEDPDGLLAFAGESLGDYRAATAVFRFTGRRWETDGRAIFNLSPTEAVRFYHRELEFVGQEAPGRP